MARRTGVDRVNREPTSLIGSFAEEVSLQRHEKNPEIRTDLTVAGEA
jgi:hypothetical protein